MVSLKKALSAGLRKRRRAITLQSTFVPSQLVFVPAPRLMVRSPFLLCLHRDEEPPSAAEEGSSDEFPSDDEENGDEADVESGSEDLIPLADRENDEDAFIADSLLWHMEHDPISDPDSHPLVYVQPLRE